MTKQPQIARKLYATMWWLLFVPAALTVTFMFVRAVHDSVVKAEAFACWEKGWRSRATPVQPGGNAPAAGLPGGRQRALAGPGLTPAEEVELAELERVDAFNVQAKHCRVEVTSYGVFAQGVWGSGANEPEQWWELFGSLLAFVPVGLLMILNRWWRWLLRPESPSPPKSLG